MDLDSWAGIDPRIPEPDGIAARTYRGAAAYIAAYIRKVGRYSGVNAAGLLTLNSNGGGSR
jgi:hypothetical protein